MKAITRLGSFLLTLALLLDGTIVSAKTLDKIRLGNSGTGINTICWTSAAAWACSASMASIWKRSTSAAARSQPSLLAGRSQRQKLEV
jgi:hypothetical protein